MNRFTKECDKLSDNIVFPDQFIVSGKNFTLEAYGIHIGNTLAGSKVDPVHYISCVKRAQGWVKIDDGRTKQLRSSEETSLRKQAYFLLYSDPVALRELHGKYQPPQ